MIRYFDYRPEYRQLRSELDAAWSRVIGSGRLILGPEVEARTLTLTSATKSFNIAGARCAIAASGSREIQERFNSNPPRSRGGLGIEKDQFKNFILSTDDLPLITDEEAFIEVISPVLKKGNFKWKGIYRGEPINFYMKDKKFKDSIFHQKVAFTNVSVFELCFGNQ